MCEHVTPVDSTICRKPTAISGMNQDLLDLELQKGLASIKSGKVYTEKEVDAMLAEEFDI